jgi:hypothetical protein
MDVYHKVLCKLYEVTGGKDSQTVDLKDLVKGQGFLGNYNDIFQMLNGQGWIVETPKLNYVKITHWGVKEAKKADNSDAGNPQADNQQTVKKESARLIADTKQLLIKLEEFASDASEENYAQVVKKLSEINSAIGSLKSSI